MSLASEDEDFDAFTSVFHGTKDSEPTSQIDRLVLRWVGWYTRDLPDAAVDDRTGEIDSDLYEDRVNGATGRDVASRWLRGIPADLTWRLDQQRQAVTDDQRGTFPVGLPITASVVTALLIAWGCLVSIRVLMAMARGEWAGAADLVLAVILGTAIAVCGAIMTGRARQRWMGAVWLSAAAYLVVHYGMYALIASSTTISAMYFTTDYPVELSHGLSIGAVLFFAAMAVWWFPSLTSVTASLQTHAAGGDE
ncbi:hypothetical protein [Leifsonia sp. Leaf264]|uniref:hypothetical protein n=1 Tax=Leifsonia sp. Leaf264 TaxID=1736314 RepID=UPI0006F762AB|nr:hypothetical protein [Leifsonia sp. Leaf264]KQP01866.1 hypothetical protein ASF30_04720 [Leifsonia sp. Leaf264]